MNAPLLYKPSIGRRNNYNGHAYLDRELRQRREYLGLILRAVRLVLFVPATVSSTPLGHNGDYHPANLNRAEQGISTGFRQRRLLGYYKRMAGKDWRLVRRIALDLARFWYAHEIWPWR